MTKTTRVRNLTRGFTLKRSQAERAVAECAAEWVAQGESIRDLTIAESIAKRNEQAKQREPLPLAEIHGLRFEPPSNALAPSRAAYELMQRANAFCGMAG